MQHVGLVLAVREEVRADAVEGAGAVDRSPPRPVQGTGGGRVGLEVRGAVDDGGQVNARVRRVLIEAGAATHALALEMATRLVRRRRRAA